MKTYEEELVELVKPLFDYYGCEIRAATDEQLKDFERIALENGLPEKGITELKRFYKTSNGIPCLDSIDIHSNDDPIIYECWEEHKQLWVGQRDMDMISWSDGKFHLGSAGCLNYGEDYIFDNLLELLKKGFKDWYPETNGKFPH